MDWIQLVLVLGNHEYSIFSMNICDCDNVCPCARARARARGSFKQCWLIGGQRGTWHVVEVEVDRSAGFGLS